MPLNEWGIVRAAHQGLVPGANAVATFDQAGGLVVVDFFTKAIIDGHGYQVRAGTITTPIAGDVAVTDTAAEMCADCVAGQVIIPVEFQATIDAAGGDALEVFAKSVATISSAGTAFVPLPMKTNGAPASTTARAATAGGVTVTAELATTTLRHYGFTAEFVQDAGTESPVHVQPLYWEPLRPPVLVGARCFYVQIASATTAPNYYAHFNYLEFTAGQLGA